jgi:H+/Cl- antiporter ClcA
LNHKKLFRFKGIEMHQTEAAKYIIIAGILLIIVGLAYYYFGNLFGWLGKLPGDIRYESGSSKVFFPITTCIVITIIINIIIYLIKRYL